MWSNKLNENAEMNMMRAWTGLIWLRVGYGGGGVVKTVMNHNFTPNETVFPSKLKDC
jgi:hypothetical protein